MVPLLDMVYCMVPCPSDSNLLLNNVQHRYQVAGFHDYYTDLDIDNQPPPPPPHQQHPISPTPLLTVSQSI